MLGIEFNKQNNSYNFFLKNMKKNQTLSVTYFVIIYKIPVYTR